ncbi:hypothetical protein EIB18_12835 [Caulobacter vibrioides]|nr:hypothetical protein CA608_13200 [Caulobacter vibrioides]ATC29278.1 hypothetical protein CA607_13135 [Caulobacter vibrioides]AZH13508.1 hypothetical protein EIB18_12835 [Caulobacter vibrioides]PLR14375.1 hypothetical protein CVUC_04140 [Caulobacter vibrioides]QXZ50789.1 transposase [Caulobacter vibrioides]
MAFIRRSPGPVGALGCFATGFVAVSDAWGKVRAECLNTAWFISLDDARSKREARCKDYNEHRPHSAIGDKCPIELMNGAGPYGPPAPDRREIPALPSPRLGARSWWGGL